MKIRKICRGILPRLVCCLVLGCSSLQAGITNTWVSLQGGGGESYSAFGTLYGLKGTMSGSRSSLSSTGGVFALSGHLFAENSATISIAQPSLTITRNADGSATVSWPALSTGYAVEQSASLSPGVWTNAPYNVNYDNIAGIRWFTVQPSATRMFYRLKQS